MHWASPAIVYAGCEFAITTLMAGSGLVASYSISRLLDSLHWFYHYMDWKFGNKLSWSDNR